MKVYIIEITGKPDWDGISKEIRHISSSYLKASQWLLDKGFKIHPLSFNRKEANLTFYKKVDDYFIPIIGKIIEKEVDND